MSYLSFVWTRFIQLTLQIFRETGIIVETPLNRHDFSGIEFEKNEFGNAHLKKIVFGPPDLLSPRVSDQTSGKYFQKKKMHFDTMLNRFHSFRFGKLLQLEMTHFLNQFDPS